MQGHRRIWPQDKIFPMSFEKAEKSSGTRHKARECALQMLFAYDLVKPERFSVKDYWSELGFEQFHKGANELIWGFLSATDNLVKFIDSLKTQLKRVDIINRQSSRTDKLKELETLNIHLRARYREFVDSIVDNKDSDSASVRVVLNDIKGLIGRYEEDFLFFAKSNRSTSFVDERKEFTDNCKRFKKAVSDLDSKTLAAIDTMLETVTPFRNFADALALGTIEKIDSIDDRIRTRAEHWRIERMAIVDRNVLRLAVYEFLYQPTPQTVVINEGLELARKFSTYEATQFINGILDGIKQDTVAESGGEPAEPKKASKRSTSK